jgi:hypothetical protein
VEALLFVTACMALLMGLVGLVAGHMHRQDASRVRARPWGLDGRGRTEMVELKRSSFLTSSGRQRPLSGPRKEVRAVEAFLVVAASMTDSQGSWAWWPGTGPDGGTKTPRVHASAEVRRQAYQLAPLGEWRALRRCIAALVLSARIGPYAPVWPREVFFSEPERREIELTMMKSPTRAKAGKTQRLGGRPDHHT